MNKNEMKEKIEELEEVIHRQCMELRGWKEQYEALKKEKTVPNKSTEQSNELMAKELERVKRHNETLEQAVMKKNEKINRLMARGLWDRIKNAEV